MFRDVRVLVIEDDIQVRHLIRRTLVAMGFQVTTADGVVEGLDELDAADILVLDLYLQNGHGNTVLQRWTEMRKGPCLVISGNITEKIHDELMGLRVSNILQKPYDHEVFRYRLQLYGEQVLRERQCEYALQQVHVLKEEVIPDLQQQVTRLRLTAWVLSVIAAAAGATLQPLLTMILGG